ncbi:MAG: phage holin family protein [Propionibacteriaceae bacterium]|nr:phage holin family protein [Propionibacteriaceae bacterium]
MANRPIGDLAHSVRSDVAAIVGDISALAKSELARDGAKIGFGLAALTAALGAAALAGVLLTVALAEALVALGLPSWAAFLIDAGIVLLLGAAFVVAGVRAFRRMEGLKRTAKAVGGLLSAFGGRGPEESPSQNPAVGSSVSESNS